MLSLISLVSKKWGRIAGWHNIVVLLLVFGVYAYRDLWPLATFNLIPADIAEGPLLWTKISLLTGIAVVIPLISPRPYIPVDPQVRMNLKRKDLSNER